MQKLMKLRGRSKSRGRAWRGDNSWIKWGGTKTSRCGHYFYPDKSPICMSIFWTASLLVVFYISCLIVRWDIQRRRWWGRGARNFHPRAGKVWLGLSLDGWGRSPGVSRGWISETTHPGNLFWTPFPLVLSGSPSLCPFPWLHSGYLFFILFFGRLYQLCQAGFLWWEVEHLWLEAEHLETKGLKQVEFAVTGSKAEGLSDILWWAMT